MTAPAGHAPDRRASPEPFAALRGASRLAIDAVTGVTDIVEAMHLTIARVAPVIGVPETGRTRGITGLVYRSVRGVTRAVGVGLDSALARLSPLLRSGAPSAQREAVSAALNGVLGDYLAASNNPLAIGMQLRVRGQPVLPERAALAREFAGSQGRLVVLVHGLCMSDRQWRRDGHDHGASLARDLGCTPLYLHYNSGLHVSTNGQAFADLMDRLVRAWPVAVEELVLIGHSMGGLVSRSACHYARQRRHGWLRQLGKLVFLGTPHHGAPLERAGNWANILVGISPYTAPFTSLARIRSAGIRDLRHGNIVDEDWRGRGSEHAPDARRPAPLPANVQCFAIAATLQKSGTPGARLRSDGLVPVASALGRHEDDALTLKFPPSHQSIRYGIGHFDLLSDPAVYEQIRRWLDRGKTKPRERRDHA